MGNVLEEKNEDLEYLLIIKGVQELPFAVGKNLLADFLIGSYKNKSISKNQLDELHHFGILSWDRDKVLEYINKLIRKKMLEETSPDYNKFVKVLEVTLKGQNELSKPTFNDKKTFDIKVSEVTDQERENFKYYNDFLNIYNDEQKKAIISGANHILTIAGAGSGKTTTLIKRIEFLVKYKQVEPEKILAITFTRKTRQEMIIKLNEIGVENVNVHTFNSFAENILRQYEQQIYGRRMRVIGYSEKIIAVNMALVMLGLDVEQVIDDYFSLKQRESKTPSQLQNIFMNDCFSIIEYLKMTGQELYDFSKKTDAKHQHNARRLYQLIKVLVEHMSTNNLRDYADQIIDTTNFFKKDPLQIPKYEHLLVDEYQDVNVQQVNLIKLINPKNIFAVGDPRQSIYGWRGSDINFILHFENDFKDPEIIHLTKNYRSKNEIVKIMNNVIKEMELPYLTSLDEYKDADVKLFSFENEQAETNFILEYLKQTQIPLHEIFILARTNKQLVAISNILKQRNVKHILKTEHIQTNVEAQENHLTLATVHAIKGLEAKTVFVIGCSTQNFPCKASDHPVVEMIKDEIYDKDAEELRLFYVAISRAKEQLYMTYSGTQTNFITDEMMTMLT